jgi:hypothetical protein
MYLKSIATVLGATIALSGCASKPSDIPPSYTSKFEYKDYNCEQMVEEAQRISDRANDANGMQKRQRTRDQINSTVGVVFLFPVSFLFVQGDGPKAVEVAKLKGQMDALEQASIVKHQKGCKIKFTNR